MQNNGHNLSICDWVSVPLLCSEELSDQFSFSWIWVNCTYRFLVNFNIIRPPQPRRQVAAAVRKWGKEKKSAVKFSQALRPIQPTDQTDRPDRRVHREVSLPISIIQKRKYSGIDLMNIKKSFTFTHRSHKR